MIHAPTPLPLERPRHLVFVAYQKVGLLDLTGAQTVFWTASKAMLKRGLPGYQLHTASLEGGLIQTAEGLTVETSRLDQLTELTIDTYIVPGAPDISQTLDDYEDLVNWLRTTSHQAKRTASVCSGAFLLANAGLLEGLRAATHWAMCDTLKQRFPSIDVDADAIFIQQGSVWTSAGVSAGIDLALALVEADCGHEVAMQVAREMVVYLKRPGGQTQYSQLLQSQSKDGAVFEHLHLWIEQNLGDETLTVERLAEQARMSQRNFARVYKLRTGRTPAKSIELFRLEAARRMLENSPRNIDQIAHLCGFGDEDRMRSTFQRNLSISPRDYRSRFTRTD